MTIPSWTALTYDAYSALTAAKLTKEQDNHRAVAHGLLNGSATDTGAADAYIVSVTGLDTLVSGVEVWIIAANANTGIYCTLNVSGTGAKRVIREYGRTPWPGDIPTNGLSKFIYNAVFDVWQLLNPAFQWHPVSGYALGGSAADYLNTINGFIFSLEVSTAISAVLGDGARYNAAGFNSKFRGYAAGGYAAGLTPVNSIDGLEFSSETGINPSAVLSDGAREGAAGVNSYDKGYALGGSDGTVRAYIDGIIFATEVATNPAATLADGARRGIAGVNSSAKGYALGGTDGTVRAYIDGIVFATELATNPAATLADGARTGIAGVNSSTKGYALGGISGANYYAYIDGIIFATEAATNPAATLADGARGVAAGVNSATIGYAMGGSDGTNRAWIDGIIFSSEASSNPAAELSIGRFGPAGVQSGGIL